MIASTTSALAAALRRASWRLDRPLRVVAGGNASVPWTLLRVLEESVDAIDDGLAADVVVGRLSRCLSSDEEPEARLRRRAAELLERS